jgi:hypothetical protein
MLIFSSKTVIIPSTSKPLQTDIKQSLPNLFDMDVKCDLKTKDERSM